MRALTPVEVEGRLTRIGDAVPRLVRQYVSQHPGCRWERPLVAISNVIAPPLEVGDAEALITDCIHWFVGRSDLYLARGRRLWPTPPTLIWSHAENTSLGVLVGSAGVGRIAELTSSFDIEISEAVVPNNSGKGLIGLHWKVVAPREILDDVRLHTLELGIENVEAADLASDLPRIESLLRPAKGKYLPADYPGGIWERYTPRTGWSEMDQWAQPDVLFRFSIELDGRPSFRHFLQARDSAINEITWDDASMWQFSLDSEIGGTTAIIEGAGLLLEHRLPPAFSFWMNGLGCWPAGYDRDARLFSYQIPAEVRRQVFDGLAECLHIDLEEGAEH